MMSALRSFLFPPARRLARGIAGLVLPRGGSRRAAGDGERREEQRAACSPAPEDSCPGESKSTRPRTEINFCAPLAEHCNLKCRGCDHFAPLAEPEFADLAAFERDFARMSSLLNGKAMKIGLMGGEPLLNPRVAEYLPIARRYFRTTKIRVVTNGLLLLKQNEDFWKACRENGIMIEVTRYPINLDFDRMKRVAQSEGVSLSFYGTSGDEVKTSYHLPLDLEGGQDIRKSFIQCSHANSMIFLKKGRLYTCTIAPNIHHFSRFFGVGIRESSADSIDIHEAGSAQELFRFLSEPIPLCRYCLVEKRTFGHPWKRSRREIREWTA